MPREELVAPSWTIYEAASAHINCGAFADAEHHKREASIPAVFKIGNRTFVTHGAWYGGEHDLPRQLGISEVREALDHEQDNRTPRPAETFYIGRVFRCDMRRWRVLEPLTLLPPAEPRPEQLQQEALF